MAERFGMTGDEVAAYAKEVVVADLDEPGIEDVIRKVMADVAERNAPITETDVRKKMEELFSVAVEQVENET